MFYCMWFWLSLWVHCLSVLTLPTCALTHWSTSPSPWAAQRGHVTAKSCLSWNIHCALWTHSRYEQGKCLLKITRRGDTAVLLQLKSSRVHSKHFSVWKCPLEIAHRKLTKLRLDAAMHDSTSSQQPAPEFRFFSWLEPFFSQSASSQWKKFVSPVRSSTKMFQSASFQNSSLDILKQCHWSHYRDKQENDSNKTAPDAFTDALQINCSRQVLLWGLSQQIFVSTHLRKQSKIAVAPVISKRIVSKIHL